jgi:hypothetical protein
VYKTGQSKKGVRLGPPKIPSRIPGGMKNIFTLARVCNVSGIHVYFSINFPLVLFAEP